jgi:hypothetical protein
MLTLAQQGSTTLYLNPCSDFRNNPVPLCFSNTQGLLSARMLFTFKYLIRAVRPYVGFLTDFSGVILRKQQHPLWAIYKIVQRWFQIARIQSHRHGI